ADHHDRSVTSDFAAPTRKCAISETIAAATIAFVPVQKMNGITGMIAPTPVLRPAAMEACTGSPGCSLTPNSSVDSALSIASGSRDSRSASSSRHRRLHALELVEERQLLLL